jgi:hypothetical protein
MLISAAGQVNHRAVELAAPDDQRVVEQAAVVRGGACEQWFSSEAFVAVNWPAEPVLAGGDCAQAEEGHTPSLERRELVALL